MTACKHLSESNHKLACSSTQLVPRKNQSVQCAHISINKVHVVLNTSFFVRGLCKSNGYRLAFRHASTSTSSSAKHYERHHFEFAAVPQPDASHTAKVAKVDSKAK